MASLTADVIVDRLRSICITLGFVEALSWDNFDAVPAQQAEPVFRIPPASSQSVNGWMNFREERTDSVQIWILRKPEHDTGKVALRQTLLRDVHSLTSAIVRDGAITSGDYNVPDEGRGSAIAIGPGQEYATLRLTVPVNYETQL